MQKHFVSQLPGFLPLLFLSVSIFARFQWPLHTRDCFGSCRFSPHPCSFLQLPAVLHPNCHALHQRFLPTLGFFQVVHWWVFHKFALAHFPHFPSPSFFLPLRLDLQLSHFLLSPSSLCSLHNNTTRTLDSLYFFHSSSQALPRHLPRHFILILSVTLSSTTPRLVSTSPHCRPLGHPLSSTSSFHSTKIPSGQSVTNDLESLQPCRRCGTRHSCRPRARRASAPILSITTPPQRPRAPSSLPTTSRSTPPRRSCPPSTSAVRPTPSSVILDRLQMPSPAL